MSVDPHTAKHRFAYKGQDYFFCSGRCRERFEAEPDKFLQPKPPEPAAPAGTIYTCPMHPEVKQIGPGLVRSAAWRWSRSRSRSTMRPIPN